MGLEVGVPGALKQAISFLLFPDKDEWEAAGVHNLEGDTYIHFVLDGVNAVYLVVDALRGQEEEFGCFLFRLGIEVLVEDGP